MKKVFSFLAGVFCSLFWNGCSDPTTAGIPAVTPFDINSYAGRWYEIARMPNWFEQGLSNVCAFYSLEPDGTVKVVNSGIKNGRPKKITGKAWFAIRPEVGDVRVRFFFPFSGIYKVIKVDNAYTVAVVAGGDYSQLWILARTPDLPESELEKLLQWVSLLGFETQNLIFTEQKWQKKRE